MQNSQLSISKSQTETAKWQQKEILRRVARSSILPYTRYTMQNFRVNWHHVVMGRYLDAWLYGKIRFLMIFAPPRHTKSEFVSRRLPALCHGMYPQDKIMAASYSSSLSKDMTIDAQKIIDSPEHIELFPNSRIVPAGERHPLAKRNTEEYDIIDADGHLTGGKYRGQGVGGSFTGKGANKIIVDDPIKGREAADSEAFRSKLWNFYISDLRSRLQKNGQILITLTRWHEDDIAGRIIAKMKTDPAFDKFHILNLRAIREEEKEPIAYDPREIGEPLWPQEYDLNALTAIKANSTRDFNALYQQRPAPTEGNIIKRHWWKYYDAMPAKFDKVAQAWDLTFKGSKNSDYVVGQVWGRIGADKYLLDMFRAKVGFNDQLQAITALSAKWPEAMAKWVEDAANAAALIEVLRSKIPGLIPVRPNGSKEARAESIAPQAEAGNIWLPNPETLPTPWVHDFIEEWASFPNGTNDDIVDTTSLGVSQLTNKNDVDWIPVSMTGQSKWLK